LSFGLTGLTLMYVPVLLKQLSLLCLGSIMSMFSSPFGSASTTLSGFVFGVVISDLRLQN
ncbi:MAG: hypothetical protein K2L59_04235, partial [Muribaculaceae bacterium]|nr:hypothetical protein [Muribaculaceae bacterium]